LKENIRHRFFDKSEKEQRKIQIAIGAAALAVIILFTILSLILKLYSLPFVFMVIIISIVASFFDVPSLKKPGRDFLVNLTANVGDRRNSENYSVVGYDTEYSDKTRALLKDSPDLSTNVYVSAMFAYITSIGVFGVSFGYHPTTIEYNQGGLDNEVGHGFIYSMLYVIQLPVTDRISILGMSNLEFMTGEYADTWYSVETETDALQIFDADPGLRDIQIAFQLGYRLSNRVSISLDYLGTILMGDAKKSPYTIDQLHQTIGLQTSYGF